MQVWMAVNSQLPLSRVGDAARRAEALGADCVVVADNAHDGLLAAMAAIGATSRIEVATMALVAFARSPMVTAVAAWGLQDASAGRFRLGLGPLVAPIMQGKYSVPWFPPAPRMRDYVASLKTIFDCWRLDKPLHHVGSFYQFTKQSAYNKPPAHEYKDPPIHLGAIGPNMTALAGEIATGIMTHPTNSSPEFIRNHLLPHLEIGTARVGYQAKDVDIIVNPPLAVGRTREDVCKKREYWRNLLAILYSTPNYRTSLELFGYPDLGRRLQMMIRENRWGELAAQIDDALLDKVVYSGSYEGIADLVGSLYASLSTTVCLTLPDDPADDIYLEAAVRKTREIAQ